MSKLPDSTSSSCLTEIRELNPLAIKAVNLLASLSSEWNGEEDFDADVLDEPMAQLLGKAPTIRLLVVAHGAFSAAVKYLDGAPGAGAQHIQRVLSHAEHWAEQKILRVDIATPEEALHRLGLMEQIEAHCYRSDKFNFYQQLRSDMCRLIELSRLKAAA